MSKMAGGQDQYGGGFQDPNQQMAQQGGGGLAPPREDANAPDLYIPAMAFVTYVLVAGTYRTPST